MKPHHQHLTIAFLLAAAALLLVRCATNPATPPLQSRTPQSIEVAGAHFDIGTDVVLWHDADGYDAYRREKFFTKEPVPDGMPRYEPLRGNLPDAIAARAASHGSLSLADLQQVVHQFVIHFDVCGTSRQCFKILQDRRTLSVHFLLDVDGTIYQTLDLREKALHAKIANDFSVGVEIAHPGAYPQPMNADMRRFYEKDELGWKAKFPAWIEYGVRTANFVARPARPDIVAGRVQGDWLYQLDFTPQQYAALARLCAGLNRVFPRIALDAPRDASGEVRTTALAATDLRAFDGIVGHFHVQDNKNDPGPAFQWERVLQQARRLREEPR